MKSQVLLMTLLTVALSAQMVMLIRAHTELGTFLKGDTGMEMESK